MEKICVAVRLRPPVSAASDDGGSGGLAHWRVDDNTVSLCKSMGTPIAGASYTFDHVFDQECDNERVYDLLAKDIIRAAVDGFNGTAFAYGQTSSGKTYTMHGTENDLGVIQLAVRDVFENIKEAVLLSEHKHCTGLLVNSFYVNWHVNKVKEREFLIRVSYMEIYNEEINDLFSPGNQKLQIHESLERGVFVAGLREEIVSNADQVFKLLQFGEVNRHSGKTNMNARSSRSHTIFRMVIESRGTDTCLTESFSSDAVRVSVLNLVDLAGSERVAKTGAGGVRLREGKHINKSLMILGNVINKLSDSGKQRAHIPYRDSKLTRILQPALGGNAKTSIICTIAPEELHIEETRGTLQFASRAKRITNCIQVNEILTDSALLKRQKLEIEDLRRKLQGSQSEVLEQEILKLRNDMLKYELERERLAMELEEERRSKRERDSQFKEQEMKINHLSGLVSSSEVHESNKGEAFMSQSELTILEEDSFQTPFKSGPTAFVMSRSNYSQMAEFSPISDDIADVVDEDTWLKMNKGLTTDLDTIQMTPFNSIQSSPIFHKLLDVAVDKYKDEIENLRSQLQDALHHNDELEEWKAKQLFVNKKLTAAISELQEELSKIQEVPQKMCESIITCKDLYKDILSIISNFADEKKSPNAKLLCSIYEIGTHLFSTLETHLLRIMDPTVKCRGSLVQECQELSKKLNSAISTIVDMQTDDSTGKLFQDSFKDLYLKHEAGFKVREASNLELKAMKDRCEHLESEDQHNLQKLGAAEEKCRHLERECNILKEEKDGLAHKVSSSIQTIASLTLQKEEMQRSLLIEQQKRREMQEEVKKVYLALANRHGLLVTLQNDFSNKIDELRKSKKNGCEIRRFLLGEL